MWHSGDLVKEELDVCEATVLETTLSWKAQVLRVTPESEHKLLIAAACVAEEASNVKTGGSPSLKEEPELQTEFVQWLEEDDTAVAWTSLTALMTAMQGTVSKSMLEKLGAATEALRPIADGDKWRGKFSKSASLSALHDQAKKTILQASFVAQMRQKLGDLNKEPLMKKSESDLSSIKPSNTINTAKVIFKPQFPLRQTRRGKCKKSTLTNSRLDGDGSMGDDGATLRALTRISNHHAVSILMMTHAPVEMEVEGPAQPSAYSPEFQ